MKKNYFKSILIAGLLVSTLSSCLKDDSTALDPAKGVNVIEFDNPTQVSVIGTTTALYSLAYPIETTNTIVPVTVSYSGPEAVAPQDIVVSLGLGAETVVDDYNHETDEDFEMMDPAVYTIDATSVTIPKGQAKASFNVSIKTSQFDLTAKYALPLKITAVSSGTISGNYGTILLNLAAKNKFDGRYQFIATATAPDRPTFLLNTQYTYPYDVELRTTGPNSNNLYNQAYGDFLIPLIGLPNATSGLGSTNLEFTFDPTTNKIVTAANKITNPGNGRQMSLDASANATSNYWDPASKDVFATFFVTQPGFSPLKYTVRFRYLGVR
ncbi:MAG: DUF1735 domain-containing protein [Flavobacteriales bacterium]|nr:MAG: DUF1735 domain-containing protein [Flavobacteriales bacterium]